MSRDWLDSESQFLFGKYGPKSGHPGRTVRDVLREDSGPGYIRWALDNSDDMSDGDREILESYLKFKGRV